MVNYVLVLALGLAAGSLSGIIGTGASIMLLPVLVFQFGPKQAVPIMAIAALMSNVAKIMAWWREVDWRAFAAYSITGIPAAALGAHTAQCPGIYILRSIAGRLPVHRSGQLTRIDGQQGDHLPATWGAAVQFHPAGSDHRRVRDGWCLRREGCRSANEHRHVPACSRWSAAVFRSRDVVGCGGLVTEEPQDACDRGAMSHHDRFGAAHVLWARHPTPSGSGAPGGPDARTTNPRPPLAASAGAEVSRYRGIEVSRYRGIEVSRYRAI
jgi:hypothetical protein